MAKTEGIEQRIKELRNQMFAVPLLETTQRKHAELALEVRALEKLLSMHKRKARVKPFKRLINN